MRKYNAPRKPVGTPLRGGIMRYVRVIGRGDHGDQNDRKPSASSSPLSSKVGGFTTESDAPNDDNVRRRNTVTSVLHVYTDGSCVHNGGKKAFGGIGGFFGPGDPRNISECVRFGPDVHGAVTNQATEILACLRAIERAAENSTDNTIVVLTDSEYVVKSMNVWAYSWYRNGWKNKKGAPIANVANMRRLFELKRALGARFVHVPAHTDEPAEKGSRAWFDWFGNAQADELAKRGAARCFSVSFRARAGRE